ncbi:hypothetical protein GVAV_002273 [Gurleya vavrai]
MLNNSLCASSRNFTLYENLFKAAKNGGIKKSIINKSSSKSKNKDHKKNDRGKPDEEKSPESRAGPESCTILSPLAIVRIYDPDFKKIQFHYHSMINIIQHNRENENKPTHFLLFYQLFEKQNFNKEEYKEIIFNENNLTEIYAIFLKQIVKKFYFNFGSSVFVIEICKINEYFYEQENIIENFKYKKKEMYESKIFLFFDPHYYNDIKNSSKFLKYLSEYLSLDIPSRHKSQLDFVFFSENHNLDLFVKSFKKPNFKNERIFVSEEKMTYYNKCDFVFFRNNHINFLFIENDFDQINNKECFLDNFESFCTLVKITGKDLYASEENIYNLYDEKYNPFGKSFISDDSEQTRRFVEIYEELKINFKCNQFNSSNIISDFFKDVNSNKTINHYYFASKYDENCFYLKLIHVLIEKNTNCYDENGKIICME